MLPFEQILWAHVGKAGGNSFRPVLRAYCESNKKKIDEECSEAPDSMLSYLVNGFLHDADVRPPGAIEEADAYLYNLRHPVDRMISWYYYEHPGSCLHNRETKVACGTAKEIAAKPDGRAARFYKNCFPTQDLLPLAFSPSGRNVLNHSCADLARKAIEGRIDGTGFKHIWYNINYYTERTIQKYPGKGVLVVRTESLWDDLKDLDLKLGGFGSFGSLEGTKDTHGSEQYHKINDTLPAAGYQLLCCAMQEEMHTYRRLLDRAVNLDEAAKIFSTTSAARRCGFSSWNDMVDQCKQQFFGMHQIAHRNPPTSLLPSSPALSFNNILFTHVGKAGGNVSASFGGMCASTLCTVTHHFAFISL